MVVICVLGIGRLGGNIAGDLAFNGHSVRVWDADKNALDKLHERLDYERKRLKDDKVITLPKFLVRYTLNYTLFKRESLLAALLGTMFLFHILSGT